MEDTNIIYQVNIKYSLKFSPLLPVCWYIPSWVCGKTLSIQLENIQLEII